jgi:hypothetical protein
MQNHSDKKTPLPKEFSKYFWDVIFEELDLRKHRNFILERMLNYGTSNTFKWIFNSFKKEEVKKWLDARGKYSLSRNSYLFWRKIAQEEQLWKRS